MTILIAFFSEFNFDYNKYLEFKFSFVIAIVLLFSFFRFLDTPPDDFGFSVLYNESTFPSHREDCSNLLLNPSFDDWFILFAVIPTNGILNSIQSYKLCILT